MNDLGPIPISKALEFLETQEVQHALASLFPGTQSREGKMTIQSRGFWVFASGIVEEVKPPSAQAELLYLLYSQLKEYLETNEEYGTGPCFDYNTKWEKARERIHSKLKDEGPPVGRIIIEIVVIGNKSGYRLNVMPSVQIAQAIRSRAGPTPMKQISIAPDAVSRRAIQIQRSAPLVLSRSDIDDRVETALSGNLADVLILPGSFQSGKSTWLLDFYQRKPQFTAYHPFWEDDAELLQESCFAESLAVQLAAFAGVSSASKSALGVDSCAKLSEFIAALEPKLGRKDFLILIDGIDQAGALLGRILTMLRQYLQGHNLPLRWVVTVRASSPALLALSGLPRSSIFPAFDDESCVIKFIQSYLETAFYDCPNPDALAREVYGQAGSNIDLIRQVAHSVLQTEDANKGNDIDITSIASESLDRTRQTCPEEKWKDLLRVLRTLALLPEDSPPALLPFLTGWDKHSIASLASLAPEIIQPSSAGYCVMRPPSLRTKILQPPTTLPDVVTSLLHDLAKRCKQVIAEDSQEGSDCRHVFTYLVMRLRDPIISLDLISDSALRILRTKPETTPEQFRDLLRRRAECSLVLQPGGDSDKHILAAATLAESNRRTAERGDTILSLWQPRDALEHIILNLNYSLTESGIIELIASAEASAVRGCPALTAKLVEACADLEDQLRENTGDAILGVLKPIWGHRYAGRVVARLALTDTHAASAVHCLFLSAVKEQSHAGPVYDYCAQLLTALDGREKSFCRDVLDSTARSANEQLPTVSEHLASLGSIGRRFSFDETKPSDEERFLQKEICQYIFGDAADILETVAGKSRAACAPELRKYLNACWKLDKPDASKRVKDIMTYFRATGIMQKPLATMLRNSIAEVLADEAAFWIAPYNDYRELMRAAEHLVNEAENHEIVKLVIDSLLEHPVEEILFEWTLLGKYEFFTAILSVASKVGDDYFKDTWDRIWKATGKLRKMNGERLAGRSLLLKCGSAARCEWLNEHMIRQLLRLRLPAREKTALRASIQSPPVDGADYNRCLSILSSLKPISSPVLGTIPSPDTLARFLASCVDPLGFHTHDMARHLLGLKERFVGPIDEDTFLRVFLKSISDPQARCDMLNAMREMHTADEHARLCLAMELRCPGTLRAKDVEGVNLSKIDGTDFLLYAGVIMAKSKEHRALLLSRLPSIREVSKRAMLIHQYVEAENSGPALDSPPSTVEPLSTDRIACAAMEELKQMDIDTLLALEQQLNFDLESFKILHVASQKVEGVLPEGFIRRQVERVFPSLRLAGQRQSEGTVVQPQSQEGFSYEDGKSIGEELLRCGDAEIRIELFTKIAQEISSCGRWISVGFLDTANVVLRERSLEEPLRSTIRRFPMQFEERYHSAFYGRLVRYLGDVNHVVREEIWSQASTQWFVPEESPFKRAGRVRGAFGVLLPRDTPGLYVSALRRRLDELLSAAREAGVVYLLGVFALLLKDMDNWLEIFRDPMAAAFGELLDDLPGVEHDVTEEMMEDLLLGLNDITKTEAGVGFVCDVCSVKASRWEVFMCRLAGRRDDDGDLETWSHELSKNIIAHVWPGDPAARLWIESFKAGGGEDVMWMIKKFTHSMVKGPCGAKWADLCDELIDGTEPEVPPEEWPEFEQYCKHWTSLVRELHVQKNEGKTVPFLIIDSEDYERFFLCMRDGPDPAEQKAGALWLFKQIFVEDPEIIGRESSRVSIISMAGEVFADHPWKQTFAEAFLEVAEAESSIVERINHMMLAAVALKSASIFRGICDLLTAKSIAECMPGATKHDLAFAIRVGTTFQLRSLYPTIDSEGISTSKDLALLQKQALAYRAQVLNEEQPNGVEEYGWTSVQAFVEGSTWAQYFAAAAEVCLGDALPATIPIPYWWRIARCARLTSSPHFLKLLCKLRNASAPNTSVPPEVECEVLSVLIDAVETPHFPELYGYAQSFIIGQSPVGDGSYTQFFTELPVRLSNACDALT